MHLFPLFPLVQKVPPTHSKSPSLSFPFLCVFLFALNWRSLGIIKTLRACLYHRYLWKAHGAILPDYSYLLNWVKCNVIPKTAFRMKEKACKAREIIAAIWVTENAKQRSTILFCVCVDCVRLFVLVWIFSCLMYPNKRILHGVHDEPDKNHPKSCRVGTKHSLHSGQWHICGGDVSSAGKAPCLFILHPANNPQGIQLSPAAKTLTCIHLSCTWNCQLIFVHIKSIWKELSSPNRTQESIKIPKYLLPPTGLSQPLLLSAFSLLGRASFGRVWETGPYSVFLSVSADCF